MKKFNLNNDNYKIEKGVPIPELRMNIPKYPLDKMKIGESFLIKRKQIENDGGFTVYRRRLNAAFSRKTPKKFCMRTRLEGLRIWRTK